MSKCKLKNKIENKTQHKYLGNMYKIIKGVIHFYCFNKLRVMTFSPGLFGHRLCAHRAESAILCLDHCFATVALNALWGIVALFASWSQHWSLWSESLSALSCSYFPLTDCSQLSDGHAAMLHTLSMERPTHEVRCVLGEPCRFSSSAFTPWSGRHVRPSHPRRPIILEGRNHRAPHGTSKYHSV